MDNVLSLTYKIGVEEITPEVDDSLSEEMKDFIALCLQRDVNKRAVSKELLSHKLFQETTSTTIS